MSKAATEQGPRAGGSYAAKVHQRWKGQAPDWVRTLAQVADAEADKGISLVMLGTRIGISGSVISGIMGNTYPGKLDRHEATVRGALMRAVVDCPVLGEIGRDTCAAHQASKFSAANPQRVKLHRACKTCPNNIGAKP